MATDIKMIILMCPGLEIRNARLFSADVGYLIALQSEISFHGSFHLDLSTGYIWLSTQVMF